MKPIYLDHATTTPVAPEVFQAMLPHLGERFGNPSSPLTRGRAARRAIDTARAEVAALIGVDPAEVLFTGSATEANNLALKGIALAGPAGGGEIIAASTEHISVLHPLRTLARRGFQATLLPVDPAGMVDPDRLRRVLSPRTLLVSIAHASAEIGTVQPIEAICRMAHARGVPVHTDATLTAASLPPPASDARPDLITLTPHLFYGPQGVGALVVRAGLRLAPLIEGGSQEGGLRAGTEPVAPIAGFGAAAALAARERPGRAAAADRLAARMRALIAAQIPGVAWTGDASRRVPGLLTLCVRGVEAEAVLSELDACGIEAASGSACTTEVRKASHVLEAIGVEPVLARGALTLAFGALNGHDDADEAAPVLARIVRRLRELSPIEAG